jgi:hypothetical protein
VHPDEKAIAEKAPGKNSLQFDTEPFNLSKGVPSLINLWPPLAPGF